jgi:hypothetical protein
MLTNDSAPWVRRTERPKINFEKNPGQRVFRLSSFTLLLFIDSIFFNHYGLTMPNAFVI